MSYGCVLFLLVEAVHSRPVFKFDCPVLTVFRFIAQVLQQLMEQLAKGQFVTGKGMVILTEATQED